MDFQKKNFRYATKPFREFVRQIKGGSKQYLRTLAAEKPAVKPANFASDFPELQPDFKLPPQLGVVEQNAHSSPLRISGPVIMWLHYDVGSTYGLFLSPYADHRVGYGQCSLSNPGLKANDSVPSV